MGVGFTLNILYRRVVPSEVGAVSPNQFSVATAVVAGNPIRIGQSHHDCINVVQCWKPWVIWHKLSYLFILCDTHDLLQCQQLFVACDFRQVSSKRCAVLRSVLVAFLPVTHPDVNAPKSHVPSARLALSNRYFEGSYGEIPGTDRFRTIKLTYVFDNQIRMHICSCSRGSLTWGHGRHLPHCPKLVWPWSKIAPGQKRRPLDLWTDLRLFCCIPPRPKSTYIMRREHQITLKICEPCIHPYWHCPNLMCGWQSSISSHFSMSGLTKPAQYCLSLFGLSRPT